MYYSLTRYVALAKARLDPSTLCVDGLKGLEASRKRKPRKWSPLEHIHVPRCTAADGKSTMDSTLDTMAYQLLRDNLLPSVVKGGTTVRRKKPQSISTLDQLEVRAEELQREALSRLEHRVENDMSQSRGGIMVRRSIAETALVIGCDEAGRGPLAGPVVGAAVCRVPNGAFTKPPTTAASSRGGDRQEPFAVADSKRMNETQRKSNFLSFTGSQNVFDLIRRPTTHLRIPRWQNKKSTFASTPDTSVTPTIIEDATTTPGCATLCLRGVHSDAFYRYHWGITIANHAVVDDENIFASSMNCMHAAAHGVWMELERPLGGDHGSLSTSQLLFHLYANLIPFDDEAELLKELDFPSAQRDTVFGSAPRQPPLVLVDGSHAPDASIDLFGDVEMGGAAHSVVKGDARSWSVAAASNLAKVCRDDIMDMIHSKFPEYDFLSHHGYPVASHLKNLKTHGLSPVHRRSYKPCSGMCNEGGVSSKASSANPSKTPKSKAQ
jgi:ribonuclease HII